MADETRYEELAAFNNMIPTATIHPGDILKIPCEEA